MFQIFLSFLRFVTMNFLCHIYREGFFKIIKASIQYNGVAKLQTGFNEMVLQDK